MTSRSRKKPPTTPPNTSAANRPDASRVAEAYRVVDRATRSAASRVPSAEPLWLPAGWLAALLILTAATPSFGAPRHDGWQARGASNARSARLRDASFRQVAYEDDIAGPALRTAGRMPTDRFMDGEYRVAQQNPGDAFGDALRDSFERPFGPEVDERPVGGDRFSDDADTADRLFDDLPDEPAEVEEIDPPREYDDTPEYDDTDYGADERAPNPDSLFDDEPEQDDPPRRDFEPRDDLDDLAKPFAERRDDGLAKQRAEAVRGCEEGLAELRASRIDMIDLSIALTGSEGEDYPYACSLHDGSIFTPRQWCEITYMWKASGLCHKPLYFEDVHLERYGHSWGPYVQPLVSGAHFFTTLPILPYKMGLKAPNECVYALGHYRPGNCAPYMIDPIPFTWRAALSQAGATVGAAAILP